MTTATRTEGPRAPLFYCALLIAPVQLALAQSVEFSELETCAGLETDAAKLACFEAIVAAHSTVVQVEPESPAPAPQSEPADLADEPPPSPPLVESVADVAEAPVEQAPPPVVARDATSPPAAAPVIAAEVAPRTGPAVQEVSPAVATQPAPATPVRETRDPMEGLGTEESKPEVVRGTVVKITKDSYGRLIFHFDNGQEWRQIEKRYYPYPRSGEFDVTISAGMMGEHRLQVEGAGRRVAIRRLR